MKHAQNQISNAKRIYNEPLKKKMVKFDDQTSIFVHIISLIICNSSSNCATKWLVTPIKTLINQKCIV